MVSPQNPTTATVTETVIRTDRGFIPEGEATLPTALAYPQLGSGARNSYFWGAVIAGSLLALSIFVLSWLLMLGCHVGITRQGFLALGVGAAWWTMVTSCIAFFFGGWLAGCISRPVRGGWLKGATVWALCVPLALIIFSILSASGGLLASSTAPHVNIVESANTVRSVSGALVYGGISFGAIWTGFWTLLVGLFFAIVGGSSGFGARDYFDYSATRPINP